MNEIKFKNDKILVKYNDEYGGSIHITSGNYEGTSIMLYDLNWLIGCLLKIKESVDE